MFLIFYNTQSDTPSPASVGHSLSRVPLDKFPRIRYTFPNAAKALQVCNLRRFFAARVMTRGHLTFGWETDV